MGKFSNWIGKSRVPWGRDLQPGEKETTNELEVAAGSLQRIAAALEAMRDDIAVLADGERRRESKRRQRERELERAERVRRAKEREAELNIAPELLAKTLDVLNLSVRASNCLAMADIHTVADLIARSADELLELRNFGQTTLHEVRERLAEHGLKLAPDDQP